LKVFDYKILLGCLEFNVKVISSEYLLLAAVVEVAMRTVTLPNFLLFPVGRARVCWFCSDCGWWL